MLRKKAKIKPKIAIVSLTSCEGCQFVMLDQGQRFLSWLKNFEVDEFRLIEDVDQKADHYDLCLIEGNPVTTENLKMLKAMREKSDLLVVVGNCAALGGVWELKNYGNKQKTIRQVYKSLSASGGKVENPEIKEVDNFVKVDFTIPGCPIDGEEFMELVYQLLKKKQFRIPQNPVCYECHSRGYECLLQKGEICLGPITLAGCQAVCLKSKQACWGCRGLLEGAPVKNLMSHLEKNFPREQIYRVMEVFGCRDTIMAELAAEKKKKKTIKK